MKVAKQEVKQEEKQEEKKQSGKVEGYSIYPIQVSVFETEKGINVKIEKRYKNKDGKYDSTNNFNLSDLPVIKSLLEAAISDQTSKSEREF